jgi:excisionase family DNA binding protein
MKTPDLKAIETLDPNAVFSLGEAAKLLGLTHNGIRNRVHSGKIGYGKNGGRYFISGAEIPKQITLPEDTGL